jgi:AcrR family transcriptional regulator
MMRPGRGMPREEAERNHRERLFAAMVASVVEKGYDATRVADLVELSGISRTASSPTRRSASWPLPRS